MAFHAVDRLESLPSSPPEATYAVVDVIISTTTVVDLLDAGARYVRPFASESEALEFGEDDDSLVFGEQSGLPLDGFDGVPLPSATETHDVGGRRVGLYTSNGTRAIDAIGRSTDVVAASTVNAGAVAGYLAGVDGDVWLVASGRMSTVADEDVAGVRLVESHLDGGVTPELRSELELEITESPTAEWLGELGFASDVERALEFDSTDTVPVLVDGVFRRASDV
ncbi:MAG: 2-phosphosulfolactate phosphatase [Halobacteriales archaeon]